MIDSMTPAGDGWARFSDDKLHRYRLARALTPRAAGALLPRARDPEHVRAVFVMLNPSVANAFKPDPTISRCVGFAQRWGADILEVVNLFAFISPHPKDLRIATDRGDGPAATAELLDACAGAARVILAWGNVERRFSARVAEVCQALAERGIRAECFDVTGEGQPKHPSARGVHRIADDAEPVPFELVAVAANALVIEGDAPEAPEAVAP